MRNVPGGFAVLKKQDGFRLVEVLLATTILMIVIGVAMESFFIISNSWEKSTLFADKRQMKRTSMECIAMQLKSIFPYKTRVENAPISWFFGGSDTLSFVTATTLFRTMDKNPGLTLVTYSVNDENMETGEAEHTGLELKQDYPPSIRMEGGESSSSLIIDRNAIGLRFKYFTSGFNNQGVREGHWLETWDPYPNQEDGAFRTSSFPEIVEFKIGYPGGGEGDTTWTPPVRVALPIAKTPLQMVSSFGGFFGGDLDF